MIQHWPADLSDWQQHIGRTNSTSHFFTFFKFNQDCWWLFCQHRSKFCICVHISSYFQDYFHVHILLTPCAQSTNHRFQFPCKVSQLYLSIWLATPKKRGRGNSSALVHLSCTDFGGWHRHCMTLPWELDYCMSLHHGIIFHWMLSAGRELQVFRGALSWPANKVCPNDW